MTIRRSILSATAGTALFAAAFLGAVVLSSDHGPRFSPETFPGTLIVNSNSQASPPSKAFTISGSVVDLYPGAHKTLTVKFNNDMNQDIRVISVNVQVQTTNKTGCSTTAVSPTNYSNSTGVLVKKNSSATLNLPISMGTDANNACSGATFSLTYSGSAVSA